MKPLSVLNSRRSGMRVLPVSARPALREIRATGALAAPLAVTQLAQMAMSFVDVVMIGRLGTEALAGGVLGSTTFFSLAIVCVGVVMAVNPSVAQAYGAGDRDEAARAMRQGLWLAVLLGIPLFALLGSSERLLLATGQDPTSAALGGAYLRAIRWGLVPELLFTALRGFSEGLGRPRPALIITLVATGLNAFGNWVLMYGHLGAPALGLEGCGWSSAIVMLFMSVGLALYVQYAPSLRRYRAFAGLRRPDLKALRALTRLGWPIGVQFGLEAGLFLAATLLIGRFGELALAAHQVALNAASVAFMVPLGIGMAATVRVGHGIGRGDAGAVARAGWVAITLGCLAMFFSALVFWLRPGWIIWIYTGQGHGYSDPEVMKLAAALLGVAAVFQLFDGTQAAAAGALRGLKDTRIPMLIGAVAYWGIGLGSGIWFARAMQLEAIGVWWGLTLGLAAAAVLLVWRFAFLTRREKGRVEERAKGRKEERVL